jgi:hypothetical protein
MRRLFLTFILLSFAGWSQPAPQQAQPPIVVQVQMPPESAWASLLKLAIPAVLAGAVGGGIAIYGVSLTNRHQQRQNKAHHTHEILKWRNEQQFQLRKEFYLTLIKASYNFKEYVRRYAAAKFSAETLPAADNTSQLRKHAKRVEQLKLALSGAISVGWILLSKEQFEQLLLLDKLAFNLMAHPSLPSEAAFDDTLRNVVEYAKKDLGVGCESNRSLP